MAGNEKQFSSRKAVFDGLFSLKKGIVIIDNYISHN